MDSRREFELGDGLRPLLMFMETGPHPGHSLSASPPEPGSPGGLGCPGIFRSPSVPKEVSSSSPPESPPSPPSPGGPPGADRRGSFGGSASRRSLRSLDPGRPPPTGGCPPPGGAGPNAPLVSELSLDEPKAGTLPNQSHAWDALRRCRWSLGSKSSTRWNNHRATSFISGPKIEVLAEAPRESPGE